MTVFVDTSAWTAVKDRRDRHHLAAVQYLEGVVARRERLATTDFILDETYTLLLYDLGYDATIRFKAEVDLLLAGRVLDLFRIGEAVQVEAWAVNENHSRHE